MNDVTSNEVGLAEQFFWYLRTLKNLGTKLSTLLSVLKY